MQFETHRSRRKRIWLPLGTVLLLLVFTTGVAAQDTPADDEEPAEQPATDESAPPVEEVSTPPAPEVPAPEVPAPEVPAPAEEQGEEPAEAEASGSLTLGAEASPPSGEADIPVEPAPAATPAEKDDDVEEILVTGTRIGRSNLESYANITVISGEDIKISGVTTVDELLTQMPTITLQATNKQNNNGGYGYAQVDLRNLGSARTLVLLNGKRIIGPGGVDLNTVPMDMVERIEVLLDGASAIYGSDAVAGVVNIVYKDDFEGFRADISGGITTHGDGENVTISTTMGGNHDKGNMVLNLTYYRRNEIWEKDRSWAQPPIVDEYYKTDDIYPKILTGEISTGYNSIYTPNGIAWSSQGRHYFGENGIVAYTDDEYFKPDGLRYSYGLDQFLVGKMERFSATALGNYELSEFVTAFAEFDFTHRKSLNQLAPLPLWIDHVSGTNPYLPADYVELFNGPVDFRLALQSVCSI